MNKNGALTKALRADDDNALCVRCRRLHKVGSARAKRCARLKKLEDAELELAS